MYTYNICDAKLMETVLKYSIERVCIYYTFVFQFHFVIQSRPVRKLMNFTRNTHCRCIAVGLKTFFREHVSGVVVVSLESRNSRDAMLAAARATGKRKKHEKKIEILHVCSYMYISSFLRLCEFDRGYSSRVIPELSSVRIVGIFSCCNLFQLFVLLISFLSLLSLAFSPFFVRISRCDCSVRICVLCDWQLRGRFFMSYKLSDPHPLNEIFRANRKLCFARRSEPRDRRAPLALASLAPDYLLLSLPDFLYLSVPPPRSFASGSATPLSEVHGIFVPVCSPTLNDRVFRSAQL